MHAMPAASGCQVNRCCRSCVAGYHAKSGAAVLLLLLLLGV
jgi:hypothetical protein